MAQEHERSLGLWHAEWDTLPELCCLASGAVEHAIGIAQGREFDPARISQNLRQQLGGIQVPLLVISASEDAVTPAQ
jgi:3-carboxy-cis,cis-muconate cycloisomerase